MLTIWVTKWRMDFNVNKRCTMQMSYTRYKSYFTYSMQGLPLTEVKHNPYLSWSDYRLQAVIAYTSRLYLQ